MTDDFSLQSQSFKKRDVDVYNNRKSDISHTKTRKFRWSACFSFISKFKKTKTHQQIRLSQSFEDFEQKRTVVQSSYVSDTTEVSVEDVISDSLIWKQQLHPTSSLSPPPRQIKSKRESTTLQNDDNENNTTSMSNNTPPNNRNRRPLIDPTLTPRVRPRSIKTKRQPSLLRLSLDAELLQSPEIGDNESVTTFKTSRSSNASSLTPTGTQPPSAPFRSGTLGSTPTNRLSHPMQQPPLPPVPPIHIPLDYLNGNSRPHSQSTVTSLSSHISHLNGSDSPVSISAVEISTTTVADEHENEDEYEEDEKLTLKERRRRRSPLSLPNTDQLTLALKEMIVEKQQEQQEQDLLVSDTMQKQVLHTRQQQQVYPLAASNHKRQTYDAAIPQVYSLNHDIDSSTSLWRQQLLEQTIAFSFEDQSRQEAMLALEGKKSRAVSLCPIAPVEELDHHFDTHRLKDVVNDKAQYDATVSRTRRQASVQQQDESSKRQQRASSFLCARSSSAASDLLHHEDYHLSHNKQQHQQQQIQPQHPLEMICENEVATTTTATSKALAFSSHFTMTPETPPYHKQAAPSLISAPSTPNSIDSSVIDHDDYMGNERLPQHLMLSN